MITTRAIVRNLIHDELKVCVPDCFTYVDRSTWTLTEPNIDSTTILVYKNSTLYPSSNYSYNATTGKITINNLIAGNSVEVYYSAYKKYSDAELDGYIKSALVWISVLQYKNFLIGSGNILIDDEDELLSLAEYNMVALVAAILIEGRIKSYKTNELTINFTQNESIDSRIAKVVEAFRDIEISSEYHDLGGLTELEDEFGV